MKTDLESLIAEARAWLDRDLTGAEVDALGDWVAAEAAGRLAQSDMPDNMLALLSALRGATMPIPAERRAEIAATYDRDGFVFPIRVMPVMQARLYRSQLEAAETMAREIPEGATLFREYANIGLGFVGDILSDPAVTDPVAEILGDDLIVMACNFFTKEANSTSYVSWHQDLHYWGLEGDDEVTAWIALSPATRESGCMKFVPGSHRQVAEHRDTFAEDNLLTRGQEIAVEVDEADAVAVELQPGEMSLHHGRLFHGSEPNTSNDRRIGLAIRYVPASMRQISGARMCATLARGEDRHGNFELVPSGSGLLNPADVTRHRDIRDRRRAVLMRDTAAE